MFFPLHAKSDCSLGYGGTSVDDLVDHAAAAGYPALALTDLENLYGQIRFHRRCRAAGVRPLTGIELRPGFDGRRNAGHAAGRVVLMAADRDGYRSICRIASRRHRAAPPEPGPAALGGDPLPLVRDHPDGLFALSDQPQVLERLMADGRFAPERLGLLVVRPGGPGREGARLAAAHRLGINPVADLDVVFAAAADYPVHLLQTAVRLKLPLRSPVTAALAEGADRWLRPPGQAEALFHDLPEALEAAARIAERCRLQEEDLQPEIADPHAAGEAGARLRQMCSQALSGRSGAWYPAHAERLETELATIEQLGLARPILIAGEILAHCRARHIPATGRGSAGGALTLHLLGASSLDPLAHGLLFERFLHPSKSAWPDIDLDLPSTRRDEVIEWVYRRYGRERVAMVGMRSTFQRRSALREGLKAAGARPGVIEALCRSLPPDEIAAEVDFLDLAGPPGKAGENTGWVSPDDVQPAQRLIGRPRHTAAHPGGIVVGDRELADRIPLERAPKGVVVTQFDLAALAQLNVFKIDLLGNRCLDEIQETLRLSGRPGPGRIEAIPLEDAATLARIDRAETIGCFQLESPAMRSLLAQLPIRRESDLTAALALIRPGASAGQAKAAYVRRARGLDPDEPFDPAMAGRLRETHGMLLYEEDVMVLLSRVGGLSLAEADEMRAAITGSGGEATVLRPLEESFLRTAGPGSRARLAWKAATRLSAYSFNKAHAAGYARLAYVSAYLKTHCPHEFACSLINHHQGLYPLRTVAADLVRSGVTIVPPHVDHSNIEAGIERDGRAPRAVRVGLSRIRGLRRATARRIVGARAAHGPCARLRDLIDRADPSRRELAGLVLSGACDGLPPLQEDNYPFVHEEVLARGDQGRPLPESWDPPAMSAADPDGLTLYRMLVRVRNELNLLGMHLSAHPSALLRPEADRYGCVTIATAQACRDGEPVRLAALVAAMRRVATPAGIMQFITFEDETGILEGALLPQHYRAVGNRVTTPGPFLVDGHLRGDQGAFHVDVQRLAPFQSAVGTRVDPSPPG